MPKLSSAQIIAKDKGLLILGSNVDTLTVNFIDFKQVEKC